MIIAFAKVSKEDLVPTDVKQAFLLYLTCRFALIYIFDLSFLQVVVNRIIYFYVS